VGLGRVRESPGLRGKASSILRDMFPSRDEENHSSGPVCFSLAVNLSVIERSEDFFDSRFLLLASRSLNF